jgi:transcription termination/antitermination protein NusG
MMAIFIIKVTTNKEERALEMISDRAVKKQLQVFAIVKPHGLKGYIILEAADRESAEEAAFNLPYVKGIIGKTVNYEEIQQMLEPKVEDVNIEVGDIVEMIGQTFKGEKAKVTRIDKQKEEVVVSLLGASVPIPVTVKMDNVKVIRRESEESDEDDEESEESEKSHDDEFPDFQGPKIGTAKNES